MSFTLGQVQLKHISGANMFSVIRPTTLFQEYMNDTGLPLLMFVGDLHSKQNTDPTEFMCNKESDENIVSINEHNWFRLLDTIATKEKPIDYMIESFQPLQLFHAKMTETLKEFPGLHETNYKKFFQLKYRKESLMNFILYNYLPCFMKDYKPPDACFTRNIRYHLSDIRIDSDHFSPLYTTNDLSRDKSLFYFETQLMYRFLHWYNMGGILNTAFPSDKPKNMFDVVAKIETSIRDFVDDIFDVTNKVFVTQSLIFKQIKKNKNPEFCIWLAKEYYSYALHSMHTLAKDILTIKNAFFESYKTYRNYVINQSSFNRDDIQEMFWYMCKSYAHFLFAPLLELYYLFRSTKVPKNKNGSPAPRAFLSILHAGTSHCNLLVNFLVEHKFFSEGVFEGNSDFLSMSSYEPPANMHRCIVFHEHYDIPELNQVSGIVRERQKYFTDQEYLELLNGKMLSLREVQDIATKKQISLPLLLQLFKIKFN